MQWTVLLMQYDFKMFRMSQFYSFHIFTRYFGFQKKDKWEVISNWLALTVHWAATASNSSLTTELCQISFHCMVALHLLSCLGSVVLNTTAYLFFQKIKETLYPSLFLYGWKKEPEVTFQKHTELGILRFNRQWHIIHI